MSIVDWIMLGIFLLAWAVVLLIAVGVISAVVWVLRPLWRRETLP